MATGVNLEAKAAVLSWTTEAIRETEDCEGAVAGRGRSPRLTDLRALNG